MPVLASEVVNISLEGAKDRVETEIKDLAKEGIPYTSHTPLTVPVVPVYTYNNDGQPIKLNFGYIPGNEDLVGSQYFDMPEGQLAENSHFYGFFNGKRYQLHATVTAPDPREPGYRDRISLAIPPRTAAIDLPDRIAY